MKLVSIIISVYDKEITICKSILSALNKSYKNIEVVIINDGSTENTPKIIKSLNDNRIQLFSQKNKGQSKAINLGIIKQKANF